MRKQTRAVHIGNVCIGADNKIAIQSMTNTPTSDAAATIAQINELVYAGADLVRISVNNDAAADALPQIVKNAKCPLIADIHFSAELALRSIDAGIAKIRINPGNLGGEDKIAMLSERIKDKGIAVRVGANGGSLEKEFMRLYGRSATAIAESALAQVAAFERHGVENLVISVKSSDVAETVEAYRYVSSKCDHPLHLGVTEAGVYSSAVIKSSMGIGALLLDGIGDTVRASITGSPVKEVALARDILRFAGALDEGVEVISCPTCSRTVIDVEGIANEISEYTRGIRDKLTVAVMGCVVNGLGEGAAADIGVAGGVGHSAIFSRGQIIETCSNEHITERLKQLIDQRTGR